MKLYLVRHGIAQECSGPGVTSDRRRRLTDEGREKTRQVAEALLTMRCIPQCFAASPYPRALETAAILREVLNPKAPLDELDVLQPGATSAGLLAWLKDRDCGSCMAVGHMPDMANIASDLLAGRATVDLEFKKAAVCCIEFTDPPAKGAGTLTLFAQPRHLKRLVM